MSANILFRDSMQGSVLTSSSDAQTRAMEEYLVAATSRIPSRNAAVQTLRRIGSPPISVPDISNPSSSAQSILDVLASLARFTNPSNASHIRSQAISCIMRNWDSYLGPWVEYLLKNFVLVDRYPQTNKGLAFYDNILYVIPLLLSFAMSSERQVFSQKTDQLRKQVLSLVWLKVINTMHVSWGRWSLVISSIYFKTTVRTFWPELLTHAGENAEKRSASIAVQHLRRIALHLDWMQVSEMAGTQSSLHLILGCLQAAHASFLHALICGAVPALVDIFRGLLRPKVLKQYTGDRLTIDLYINTVDLVAMCLQNSFLGPMWISQALEAGFIQAVFKTFRLKVMGTDSDDSRPWQPLDGALMQIALYMVYPSVLHRFMGYMKVVGSDRMDVSRSMWPNWPLWTTWQNCCQRAVVLKATAGLMAKARPSCCYKGCQSTGLASSESRYLRCSRCLNVSYCSRDCAKNDWQSDSAHRGSCLELAQELADGSPPPNHIDLHFFTTLVRIYTFRAGEILLEAIQSPGSSMHSTLQIPGLGDEVDLSPKIVVFELSDWDPERNALFSPAPTPSLTDLNTLTREIGIETELGRRIFPELFSAVKKARKVDFVVLSFFPGIIGRPEKDGWPVVSTLCLPISTEAQTTDSDQEEGSSGYEASRESDGLEEATDDEEEEDSEYNSGEDSDDSEDSGEHIDSYE